MAAAGARFDLLAPDPETQPFWDGARAKAHFADDVTIPVFRPAPA